MKIFTNIVEYLITVKTKVTTYIIGIVGELINTTTGLLITILCSINKFIEKYGSVFEFVNQIYELIGNIKPIIKKVKSVLELYIIYDIIKILQELFG